jgi:tetratricopeptide (TPR) repeat protein
LHGEPVQASPLGTGYRVHKFIQKHKKPLLLVVAGVALLLSAVAFVKAQRDARQAQRNARQAQRNRGVNEALHQAAALRERAKAATVGSAALFARAREHMQRALALVEDGLADAALTAQVSQLQAELDAEEKDRTLVAALDEAGLAQAETLSENRFATERAVPKIREAFRAYGLAAGEGEPAAAAERIRQRPAAVREAILAALEEWDNLAGDPTLPITEPHRAWLRAVVTAAEPDDAWTKELRAALAEANGAKRRTTLGQLAAEVDVREHPPRTLTWLAKRLEGSKPAGTRYAPGPAAVALLRRAQRQYPADFWINEFLGLGLNQEKAKPEELTEAVRFLSVAVALRPESPGAHYNLGNALRHKGQFDEAIASYQKALALDPKYALAHNNLGIALKAKGQVDAAIASYQKALALEPKNAKAHDNLGGILRYRKHDYDGAIACYRTAIELDPKFAMAHNDLGAILCDVKRDYDGAIACFHTAIALDPKFAMAHYNLGQALRHKGQMDAAIASYQKALALDPQYAECHCTLGEVLARQGRFAESLEAYQRGHELGTQQPGWRYPSAEWARDAERLAALETKLPAFLQGDFQPATNAERLTLAQWCQMQKRYRTAAGLLADAFTADPKQADAVHSGNRYDAACVAAQAGCGQGQDAPADAAERARWRGRALRWLQEHLAFTSAHLASGTPKAREEVRGWLEDWQTEPDLSGVRDAAALAQLPPDERTAWIQLWADVAALVNKAAEKAN